MNNKSRVLSYVKKNGSKDPEKIRKAFSKSSDGPIPMAVIRNALGLDNAETNHQHTPKTKVRIKKRSIEDFRTENDFSYKIERAVNDLGDGYLTESEFKLVCGVPINYFRRFADLPEFRKNHFRLRDTVYWASEKTIEKMKEIAGV